MHLESICFSCDIAAGCTLLGGTSNEALTRIKSTAAMPSADEVGQGGMEGAKKALESMVDSMCPILKGNAKGSKRRQDEESSECEKRRRKRSPLKVKAETEATILADLFRCSVKSNHFVNATLFSSTNQACPASGQPRATSQEGPWQELEGVEILKAKKPCHAD